MASALETLCGQAFGAKKYHMLGIYMQRSWIVLFLCAILLLPMYLFATPILKLLGQPSDLAEQAGMVSIWLIPLHFSFVFLFPLQRFLQCQLKNSIIAIMSAVALVVHIFVSWLFVYHFKFGLIGTALTLDFSWWVSAFLLYGYVLFGGCPLSWKGFSMEAFAGLWEFLKLSAASGVMLWYDYPPIHFQSLLSIIPWNLDYIFQNKFVTRLTENLKLISWKLIIACHSLCP